APQDEKRQVAAMMLEVAPALNDSLMKVERFDVLGALLPHLVGVSELLADKTQVSEIKKLDLGFPESEFESRQKQLKELQDHFTEVHQTAQASALLGGMVIGQTIFAPGQGFPV